MDLVSSFWEFFSLSLSAEFPSTEQMKCRYLDMAAKRQQSIQHGNLLSIERSQAAVVHIEEKLSLHDETASPGVSFRFSFPARRRREQFGCVAWQG
jgi:hypothetical protein